MALGARAGPDRRARRPGARLPDPDPGLARDRQRQTRRPADRRHLLPALQLLARVRPPGRPSHPDLGHDRQSAPVRRGHVGPPDRVLVAAAVGRGRGREAHRDEAEGAAVADAQLGRLKGHPPRRRRALTRHRRRARLRPQSLHLLRPTRLAAVFVRRRTRRPAAARGTRRGHLPQGRDSGRADACCAGTVRDRLAGGRRSLAAAGSARARARRRPGGGDRSRPSPEDRACEPRLTFRLLVRVSKHPPLRFGPRENPTKGDGMKRTKGLAAAAAVVTALAAAPAADAKRADTFEVTFTDLTSGQPLTPAVTATHRGRDELFRVGRAASFGLKEIAENGNNAPMLTRLASDDDVSDVVEAPGGPLVPAGSPGDAMFGQSTTFTIEAEHGARFLSLAAMLICTNDGFTGVNALKLPSKVGEGVTVETAGYDAGAERDTEDFADIVPPCQSLIGISSGEPGTGVSNPALAEGGVIAHHPGIQGGSDLVPSIHGWTDPVTEIEVEAIG